MNFEIVKGNLFKAPKDTYFAHCISSDFALGAGIAKEFANRGVRASLLANYKTLNFDGKGYSIYTEMDGCKGVYNLVTKQFFFNKPTYDTLREALESMKENLWGNESSNKNIKLSMPKIGSGLDRLEWDKVEPIIKEVFKDTDINITIYEL